MSSRGGRKVTPIPQQSRTSWAHLGGAFQSTKQGGDTPRPRSTPTTPHPLSLRGCSPSSPEGGCGPQVPGLPEPLHHPQRGEGGSGRRGWKWGQRATIPGPRAGCPLAALAAATQRPPSPRSSASCMGDALRRVCKAGSGCGGRRSLQSLGQRGLRGPGCNFSLEARTRSGAHARSHSARASPIPRTLAPSPSFFPYCFHSHTLK